MYIHWCTLNLDFMFRHAKVRLRSRKFLFRNDLVQSLHQAMKSSALHLEQMVRGTLGRFGVLPEEKKIICISTKTRTPGGHRMSLAYPCRTVSPKNRKMKSTSASIPSSVISFRASNGRVATPGSRALDSVHNPPHPVLQQIRNIPDGVTVR